MTQQGVFLKKPAMLQFSFLGKKHFERRAQATYAKLTSLGL